MHSQERVEIFTREFLAYRSVLARAVGKILRYQPDEVADVLQDVWMKCAHSAARRDIRHYKQWMYRTAVNAAITHIRRIARKHPPLHLGEDRPVPETIDPSASPEVVSDCLRLRAAVDRLEERMPKLIAVLKLVHLEECTHLEAAAALGIAQGTSKSNAFKALAQLRAALAAPT